MRGCVRQKNYKMQEWILRQTQRMAVPMIWRDKYSENGGAYFGVVFDNSNSHYKTW